MEKRSSQLLKGVLDMCLLALIAQKPCYGYEMISKMQEQGLTLVAEGSIYPLLSRLEKNNYIEGYLVSSQQGPKRKYYRILPAGEKQLLIWNNEWHHFTQSVAKVMPGGVDFEHTRAKQNK